MFTLKLHNFIDYITIMCDVIAIAHWYNI